MLTKRGELLEVMAVAGSFEYLSELKCPENRKAVCEMLRSMYPEHYRPEQWSYTLSYIMEREVCVTSVEELEAVLLHMDVAEGTGV